ncbi:PREDICTED: collagen alpha-1(III) chain-like [Dinoponera quadriceps]|uniref:Collagen alpha-1(III) chain-like n=1 Tax=Dinoponera quadriceps TaxID=609295 RepID=A0A6P3XL83_DINQU|nr:PREDICTED: collagen alpha-1(III) chain-like [Dinoponera quadriceps]XP_014479181.1 PREDICTED: collagen alpha-1(III) chain-like [Dinoponera quadriceps]
MRAALFIFCVVVATASGEKDEPWTWNDDKQKTSKAEVGEARYQVYEPDFDGINNGAGFRPHHPGPYGPNGRPLVPSYPGNNGGILVGPGGPTGILGRPPRLDGPGGHNGILGSVPSWIREDPRYRDFDTCKCRYSFNCPSPGLKFGHCSREKKYCCFNSRKFPALSGGQHYPSYPGAPHKYGPGGFAPTTNYYDNRGPHGNPYGYRHPSFGDYYSGPYGGYGHRNEFESLRPYGYDADPDDYEIYGRSLGKNQTQASEKLRTDE